MLIYEKVIIAPEQIYVTGRQKDLNIIYILAGHQNFFIKE